MNLDEKGIVIACPACGQRNRLRYEQLGRRQRCGSCQRELPQAAGPVEINDESSFSVLIAKSALPVLVDFWAGWCGPCLMMAPELKKLALTMAGRVLVAKVNTDALSNRAAVHRISSLPTLSLLWQGRELARIMGARPAPAIQRWLETELAKSSAASRQGHP